jgi:hypothetical protein
VIRFLPIPGDVLFLKVVLDVWTISVTLIKKLGKDRPQKI